MLVGALIAIVVAIVVGVNLIPWTTGQVETATNLTGEESENPGRLVDVLIYIYIAVILIGAVAWIGASDTSSGDVGIDRVVRAFRKPASILETIGKHRRKSLLILVGALIAILVVLMMTTMQPGTY